MLDKARNYFNQNPYAQQNVGQAVQGVAGVVGMYTNIADTVQEAKDTQYDIPLMKTNPYERPEYQLGQAFAQDAAFNPNDAGKGLVGQSALTGASAGAAIGSFFPGLGTVIGAGAGAIVGTISGLFGKGAAQRSAREAKARERRQLMKAQGDYNVENTNYDSSQDARDRYEKRLQNRQQKIQRMIG